MVPPLLQHPPQIGATAPMGEVMQRRPELQVPRHVQITTVAALVLCGVVVWSILAQARRAVEAYAALRRREEEP